MMVRLAIVSLLGSILCADCDQLDDRECAALVFVFCCQGKVNLIGILSVVLCSVRITCNEKLLPPVSALRPMVVAYGSGCEGEETCVSCKVWRRFFINQAGIDSYDKSGYCYSVLSEARFGSSVSGKRSFWPLSFLLGLTTPWSFFSATGIDVVRI